MNLLLAGQIFTDKLIHAFCWTLIHSLWQGMFLALFTGIVMMATKRSAPVLRYRLLSGLFLVFVLAVCVSFAWQWQSEPEAAASRQEASFRQTGLPQAGFGQAATRQKASRQMGLQQAISWQTVSPQTVPQQARSRQDASERTGFQQAAAPKPGRQGAYTNNPGDGNAGSPDKAGLSAAASSFGLSFFDRFAAYCNSHAYLVVMIWFILFSARCLKIMTNIGYMQRLRHTGIQEPPAYWKARIGELAERLQIKRRVALLESKIAKVPMMAGFLKPVILIPIGLLAQLPADQVEAVLLHELAHIRRKDYLVNILQHFAEIIFFFNPGVLWLSSLLRDEREHCCDDMAIGETKNKQQFIHALVSFQEYQLSGSPYTMGFPGSKKGHLLQRVKRIIYNDNKTLDVREKIFLVVCLFVTGSLTLAFSQSGKEAFADIRSAGKARTLSGGIVNARTTDTMPGKNSSAGAVTGGFDYSSDFAHMGNWDAGKEGIKRTGDTVTYYSRGYEIVTLDSTLKALYYQGVRIPDERIVDYIELIDNIILEKSLQAVQARRPVEAVGLGQEEREKNQADLDKERADLDKMRADLDKQKADEYKMQADADLKNGNDDAAPVPPVPSVSANAPVPRVPGVGIPTPPGSVSLSQPGFQEANPDEANGTIDRAGNRQSAEDTMPGENDKGMQRLREAQRRLDEQRARLDLQQQQLNEEYARLGEETNRLAAQGLYPGQDNHLDEEVLRNLSMAGYAPDSVERKRIEKIMKLNQQTGRQRAKQVMELMRQQNVRLRVQQQAMMKQSDAAMEARQKEIIMRQNQEMQRMTERIRLQQLAVLKPQKPYMPRVLAVKPFVPPIVKSVIADLQAEKIITDTTTLSFTLNADVLIVNSVQQSTELHDKFKEKYITKPDSDMIYSRKGAGTSLTIHNIKR